MMIKLAEWASENVQNSKTGLSDGCAGENVPGIVKIGYCRSGFESYLGNVGLDRIRNDRTHIAGSIDPVNPVTIYGVAQKLP